MYINPLLKTLIMKSIACWTLLISCFLYSCGEVVTTEEKKEEVTKVSISLSDFPKSPTFEDATLTKMDFQDGKFTMDFDAETYTLGAQTDSVISAMCANSGDGQHFHLIVDKQPYAAKYAKEFEYKIDDGEHHVLTFLSRSYHESIKNGKAFMAKKVVVKNNSFESTEDITEPALFYSRPKGTYVGSKETDKVMLDYFLVNVDPSMGYKVMANINGQSFDLGSEWKPVLLEGLPMGENTIELTMVDSSGAAVDVPMNKISRTIVLKENPIEKEENK